MGIVKMDRKLQTTNPEQIPNFVIFKIDNSKVNIDVFFYEETLDEQQVYIYDESVGTRARKYIPWWAK